MKASRLFTSILRAVAALIILVALGPVASTLPVSANQNAVDSPTRLLRNIPGFNEASNPQYFFSIGDRFLFSTLIETTNISVALWASDGTTGNTVLLKENMLAGSAILYNEKAYFLAGDYGNYTGLWVTDGTPEETRLIYDFPTHCFSDNDLVLMDGWLYFLIYEYDSDTYQSDIKLWRSDGTAQNTDPISDLSLYDFDADWRDLEIFKNAIYFKAYDELTGSELWRLPSGSQQPEQVIDICSGACGRSAPGSGPHFLTASEGQLFFIASDDTHGEELWVSDGTEAGTHLVRDIRSGLEGAQLENLTAVGDWLYFTADDGEHGRRLWRTDGSASNTSMFGSLEFYPLYASPLEVMDGVLYISAEDAVHGPELWKITGPLADPQVIDVLPGAAGSIPDWLTVVGQGESSSLYFVAQDMAANRELWQTEAATGTTRLVKEIVPGKDGGWPHNLAAWNDRLVFSAVDPIHNREVWISDGTSNGTALAADINKTIYAEGNRPEGFKTFGGITYFVDYDPLHGNELWSTDGTTQGTYLLNDFAPGPSVGSITLDMAEQDGIVYFAGPDNPYVDPVREVSYGFGGELWRSNGTPQGTWMVKDIRPGLENSYLAGFTSVSSQVFFTANDGVHGPALWKTDGTRDGTVMVSNAIPWPYPMDNYFSYESAGLGSTLIFYVNGYDEDHNWQAHLWRSDGTSDGTVPYLDLNGQNAYLVSPESVNGKLYWKIPVSDQFRLVATDGTAGGTHQILIPNAPEPYEPVLLASFAGNMYFTTASPFIYKGISPNLVTSGLWKVAPGATTAVRIREFPQALIENLTSFGSTGLLFRVTTETSSRWWISDGTVGGTREICSACNYTGEQNGAIFRGQFYFIAVSGKGSEIWVTRGTPQSTRSLFADDSGPVFNRISQIASTATGIVFEGTDDVHGQEWWVYEETEMLYLPLVNR